MAKLRRADELVVAAGLAADVDEAARLILAGLIHCPGRRIEKAGESIAEQTELSLKRRKRFVSRGGEKLDHALSHFGIRVKGLVCLDAGCSTGGFSDCLLQRGARLVYAVDVGYGQLAWELRNDPRVSVRERTNIRKLRSDDLDPRPGFLCADLSFVSLRSMLAQCLSLVSGDWSMVLLVKPQFELSREHLLKGVVVDPEARASAVAAVRARAEELGMRYSGSVESPIRGADGNREYLLWFRRQ